jgi:succinate dehydrogenase / fumarate reductase membrane anchor subunit
MRTPLGRVRGLGSARSGTQHFWLQRMTAVSNIPLIVSGIILVIAVIGRDHAGAVAIMSHPLAAILMLLMIVSGLVHMRLGMQTIIEDYIHAEGPKVLALMANTFFAIAVGAACIFAVLKISFGG